MPLESDKKVTTLFVLPFILLSKTITKIKTICTIWWKDRSPQANFVIIAITLFWIKNMTLSKTRGPIPNLVFIVFVNECGNSSFKNYTFFLAIQNDYKKYEQWGRGQSPQGPVYEIS